MSLALADVKHPGGDRSKNSERPITAFNGPRPTLTPRHYPIAADVTIGAVLYLLSLAFVGAATVGAFFGVSLMTADFGAYDRTLLPAETELPRPISEATLPNSDFAQNPLTQAALVPETSTELRGSVREFATTENPESAAGSAQSALRLPVVRQTARRAKRAPPPLIGPVTARDGTLTPPMQPGQKTLTPSGQTAPTLQATGRGATLTPHTPLGD